MAMGQLWWRSGEDDNEDGDDSNENDGDCAIR